MSLQAQEGNAGSGAAPADPAARPPVAGQGQPGDRQPGDRQPGDRQPGRWRPDPWKAAFFGLLAVAILALAGWALLGSSLLVVRHVEVRGATSLIPAAQVRAIAAVPAGEPLSRVDTAAIARRVETIGPVLSARVTRSFPDSVVIAVRQRVPVLAVAVAGGYDLIDEYGVSVRSAERRPAGTPVLSAPPAVVRGSPAVRAAAAVVRDLPAGLRGRLVSVSAQSASAVTLHLTGGAQVLWGSAGQDAAKAAELTALLRTHASYYDVSDPATAVTRS